MKLAIHSDFLLSNDELLLFFLPQPGLENRWCPTTCTDTQRWRSCLTLYYGRSKHSLWLESKCQNLCTYSMCIHPHPTYKLDTTNCTLPLQPLCSRNAIYQAAWAYLFLQCPIPKTLTKLLALWGDLLASPSQLLSNCKVRKKYMQNNNRHPNIETGSTWILSELLFRRKLIKMEQIISVLNLLGVHSMQCTFFFSSYVNNRHTTET